MTAPDRIRPGLREVLTAPRGQRFTHTPEPSRGPAPHPRPSDEQARREQMLAQMADNPRVQRRLVHGDLPHWMHVAAARRQQADRPPNRPEPPDPPVPPTPRVPRPRSEPDRNPLPPRPRSHRRPRRTAWRLITYTLAATTGALVHHLTTLWW